MYELFFREIVQQCMDKGLVERDKLFMDATLLKANASLGSLVSRPLYCQLAKEPSEYLDDIWSSYDNDTGDRDDKPPESSSRPGQKKQTANELKISKTDPAATIVRGKDTKIFLGHKVHVAVDGGEDRIITAVTTTTGTIRESRVGAALPPIRHGKQASIPKARPWKTSMRPLDEELGQREWEPLSIYQKPRWHRRW